MSKIKSSNEQFIFAFIGQGRRTKVYYKPSPQIRPAILNIHEHSNKEETQLSCISSLPYSLFDNELAAKVRDYKSASVGLAIPGGLLLSIARFRFTRHT